MSTKTFSNTDATNRIGIGQPDCTKCGGLGYVIRNANPDQPGFGRAVPCECRAVDQEVERIHRLLSMSHVENLQHCTFDTFLSDGHGLTEAKKRNLRNAYETTLQYAQNPTGWLILKGGYGCGKTHLAAAIANYRLALGHAVLFVSTPDLLDHLRATFNPESTISYDERFDEVRNSPLLVLDDLGTQSNSEWAQEKLYQIFNYRYNAKLPTVVTTNVELEAIEDRISSRMVDPDLAQVVHIAAPDYRRSGVSSDHTNLSSLDLHNDKYFANFDLRDFGITSPDLKKNLPTAFKAAKDYAENPQNWLVLSSVGHGNGKTHLAAAIANAVSMRGDPVLFVAVPDLLDYLRAAFAPNSGIRLSQRFELVKKTPLIVLDELNTESATAWAREKLYQLLNYRYEARMPTVITTTFDIDEFKKRDPYLAARLIDTSRCTFVVIKVESYWNRLARAKGISRIPLYSEQ